MNGCKGIELYRDLNVNLRRTECLEMTDYQLTNVQTTQVTEDTHVIITPVIPEGQQQSSSVSSGFISTCLTLDSDTATLLFLAITFSTPTPLITHMQQTSVPTPTTVPNSSLQDLPNFGSLFGFDHRLKTLETDFSEFKQTNQFAEAVSSIPGIVDAYLSNKMHNPSKLILHVVAANLSELELKKILIDKMESNKSIHISNEQKNLYKELVEAYESDKLILDTYCDTVVLKDSAGESAPTEGAMHTDMDWKNRTSGKNPLLRSWIGTRTLPADHGLVTTFAFMMNRLKIDTLTPELLADPTFELIKGTCKSLVKLEYFFKEVYKATMDQLDWHNPEGKLTNLNVEDRLAFGVSLRMFTRSIVIQRRVEDLQLGVKSYQKKLNITKPDTYRSDLKCRDAYTAYSNPKGFIYQNKDKKNKLIRIDELHKFSDGTLDDVRMLLNESSKRD
ncbi:hypothetical protein Tco_0491792 [Tanacetum coccineum]